MTKNKRFELDKPDCIYDNDSIAKDGGRETYWLIEYIQQKKLVEKMNKLADENTELKAKVDDKEVAVEVECEKLMQKVLDLIDEKIKELKNINNVLIIPRESIEVLKQLKKELLE